MEILLVLIVVVALVIAWVMRARGRAAQADAGLPVGARVVSSDTSAWQRIDKALYSRRYRLAGKPDYIVRDESGVFIPIEVKPNRRASEPRHSDVMQLMAYGILVQDKYGTPVEYGLLKYQAQVFSVPFTDDLRAELFDLMAEMRRARRVKNVPRSHDEPVRCRYCGYREECDERLE